MNTLILFSKTTTDNFNFFKFHTKSTLVLFFKERLFEKKKDFFCFFICISFVCFQQKKERKFFFSKTLFKQNLCFFKQAFVMSKTKESQLQLRFNTDNIISSKEKFFFASAAGLTVQAAIQSKKSNQMQLFFFFEWFFLQNWVSG
jgi:hypothetical protein